ncbi:MAG: ceramidase domain-containing protein [Alphaproteobacteria bacterium]|nr:ceramidase domain-containing protein [Alphaproteobacteria bacterium]
MSDPVDIYCERLAPGLWVEPLNALTNLSFFVAAFFVYRLSKSAQGWDRRTQLLTFLLVLIGTGSSLFHTFATKATMLADVFPILLFQIAFIWLYALDVMRLGPTKTSILFVLFMGCTVLAEMAPFSILNGSLSYAPALLFLSGFAVWHMKKAEKARLSLLLASLIFVLSLTFRSVDMSVCDALPIGTHFFWHILNGAVLFFSARAYILARVSCYTGKTT